ncbi:MAG TPA: serpin family protein [Bacillota bacterium]|nr:serpin family protein [Bacillota bacterium]
MKRLKNLVFLIVMLLTFVFLIGVHAETSINDVPLVSGSPGTGSTPSPTGDTHTCWFITDYFDYGVQSVTSTSAVIAVGYEAELRTVGPGEPVADYLFTLKYWEDGSSEVHYIDPHLLMSFPARIEKTIANLKPGTKYYYQFHQEPVNSFTTLSNDPKYAVDFKIYNYTGGSTINIIINNLSDAVIKDWKLKWTFNESVQISQLWCGHYTQVGQAVEVTPMAWNTEIAPKSAITLGFSATRPITKPNNINLAMATDPVITPVDVTTLVNANSQFAFDIFKRLNTTETGKNVFISPLSISSALAMLYQGANGDTRAEIANALSYQGIDISVLNSNYQSLLNNLKTVDSFVTLNIGNSIWYKEGLSVKSAFLNTNNDVFGATVKSLDFSKDDAADTINNWIANVTNGKINQMVNPPLEGELYLINAIYFKGDWTEPFNPERTIKSTFNTGTGKTNTVDMMQANNTVEFGKGTDYSAIRLPYGTKKISMYCILPAQSLSIDSFIAGLNVAKFNEIKQSLVSREYFSVKLPKFKMAYGAQSLKTALNTLGMTKAFDSQADFSGITTAPIYVDDVLHKAVIDVNEQGTEAAATTVVTLPTAVQDNFHANRPFVFFLVDDTTGSILFMGKATDLVEY